MNQILVIDDDQDIRNLITAQLSSAAVKVLTASSGEKGIELARQGLPDLIILDINMPDMNGFLVLENLRKDRNLRDIPVIMLTASSQRNDVMKAMEQGIADYVKKPYKLNILHKKIDTILLKNRSERLKDLEKLSQHITLERDHNLSIVALNADRIDREIIKEAGIVFNPAFFTLTKKDNVVLDLRQLDTLIEKDIPFLNNIVEMFSERALSIVAGKHYGLIVANSSYADNIQLFISMGDLMIYLDTL